MIMSMSMSMSLADKLRQFLGNNTVADDPDTLAAHGGDKWFAAHQPEVVVFARSTDDVSKLLQFASRERIPVTARGGGFGYVGGCVPAHGGGAPSPLPNKQKKEKRFCVRGASVGTGSFTPEVK